MGIRTPEQIKAALSEQGLSVSAWAKANGLNPADVYALLNGHKKGLRGESHRIAVMLGLKEGRICNDPARALDRARA